MPERQALGPQEGELQGHVHPEGGQLEVGVEVDRDRFRNEWRAADPVARIPAHDGRPAHGADELLLHERPAIVEVPAEPRLLAAPQRLLPGLGGAANLVQAAVEGLPVSGPRPAFCRGELPDGCHGVLRERAGGSKGRSSRSLSNERPARLGPSMIGTTGGGVLIGRQGMSSVTTRSGGAVTVVYTSAGAGCLTP